MTIELHDVTVAYREGAGKPALQEVSLTFHPGEMVGILGLSGAGKSTLIRCINGLVRPAAGSVRVNGIDVARLSGRSLRRTRSRIGMVFQQFGLIPRTTVLTNVLLGRIGQRPAWRNVLGYFDRAERREAAAAIHAVGLAEFSGRRIGRLSGGQQQRVAIARAMMQQPSVMLGDEPVSNLDPVTSQGIMELFARIHREDPQRITILNLHDLELALAFCNRIVGLRGGRVVYDGSPEGVTGAVRGTIYGG